MEFLNHKKKNKHSGIGQRIRINGNNQVNALWKYISIYEPNDKNLDSRNQNIQIKFLKLLIKCDVGILIVSCNMGRLPKTNT